MDGKPDIDAENKAIIDLLNRNKRVELPAKRESLVGLAAHFKYSFAAKQFFGNPANINAAMETKVADLFK